MVTNLASKTPNFFEEGTPYLHHPLLTAERTTQEIDFVEPLLNTGQGGRLLDMGCGFGRHSVELARRGYEVTGIDPSTTLISEADCRASEIGVAVDFRTGLGERFRSDRPYDGAICLFTSLGQIGEQGENSGLVERVYAALKPGGRFVVEVPQRETAVRHLKADEKFGEGNRATIVSRVYDADTRVVSESFRVVNENDDHTYLLKYRLFDRDELEAHFEAAGFVIVSIFGDYDGASLNEEQAIMLLVAEKEA